MPLNTRFFTCNTYSYTMSHSAENCLVHLADLGFREVELAGDDPHEGLALICCDTCRQERLVRYVGWYSNQGLRQFDSVRIACGRTLAQYPSRAMPSTPDSAQDRSKLQDTQKGD